MFKKFNSSAASPSRRYVGKAAGSKFRPSAATNEKSPSLRAGGGFKIKIPDFSPEVRKEVLTHLGVVLVWLVIITLLRWQWHWRLIGLWLGGAVGTFLIDIDHLLYTLIVYPEELTSLRVKDLLQKKEIGRALVLLSDTRWERIKLAAHNALFQVILMVVCFWVLSSAGSLWGSGIVMGMALSLLVSQIRLLFQNKDEHLHQILFWPIGIKVSLKNQRFFVVVMGLIFLGLSLLLV